MIEQAKRDWYTRARVRILTETVSHSHYSKHTFHAGDELEMVQWGRAGREIDRDAWWTSFDIDGAYIIDADRVEVIEVLDEDPPDGGEPALVRCPYCGHMHQADQVESCPLKPKR